MSGSPIKRRRLALLEDMGEEAVFRRYIELGSVKLVTEDLFEPAREGANSVGRMDFYKWLKDEPGRWERWQEVQRLRGHVEADMVLEAAMDVTPKNSSSQRVKIDAHRWRAERLNRDSYGAPQAQVNVVQVGSGWLEALRGMKEEQEPEQVEEGEFEVESDDE